MVSLKSNRMVRETKDCIITFRNKDENIYRVGTLTEVQKDFGLYFKKPYACRNYTLRVNNVVYSEIIGYSETSAPTVEYLAHSSLVIDCTRRFDGMPNFSKWLFSNEDKEEDVTDERVNNERIIKHSELHSRV